MTNEALARVAHLDQIWRGDSTDPRCLSSHTGASSAAAAAAWGIGDLSFTAAEHAVGTMTEAERIAYQKAEQGASIAETEARKAAKPGTDTWKLRQGRDTRRAQTEHATA